MREESELERFKELYKIDLNDSKKNSEIYDLIIDTSDLTIEEIVDKILSRIEQKN
jgi:cytidylate kinase